MNPKSHAITRISLTGLVVAAVGLAALITVQREGGPSVLNNPVQNRGLFDIELLTHDTGALTLTYTFATQTFSGALTSSENDCYKARGIEIYQDNPGSVPDTLLGSATTSSSGTYSVAGVAATPAALDYYAITTTKTYDPSGPPVETHTCATRTSNTL